MRAPAVRGHLIGRFLRGSTLTIENDALDEITIAVENTPSDRRIDFIIRAIAPVAPGAVLTFGVAKSEHFNIINETVRYIPESEHD